MTPHLPRVPRQARRLAAPLDAGEQDVARTADLVLKLTALADRYEGGAGSPDRVALMLHTARRAREALLALAAENVRQIR